MLASIWLTLCHCVSSLFTVFPRIYDHLYVVKYVPAWFPGAGFQIQGKEWRKSVLEMVHAPFNFVKQSLVRPVALIFF
jgi:hypothetical protein